MFLFEDGRFYLEDEQGKTVAFVTYVKNSDHVLIIDGTFVDPSLRGQGIAIKLVDAVVELAKKEGKKIIPVCPFAVKLFDKNREYDAIRYK